MYTKIKNVNKHKYSMGNYYHIMVNKKNVTGGSNGELTSLKSEYTINRNEYVSTSQKSE